MKALLVIPARYASSRFPGKPLAGLRGAGGESRSLIRRTWDAARQVDGVARIVVATDDARIRKTCEEFGAGVVMTSARHGNGTERCAEVAAVMRGYDVVVNLQGDAPLTPPWFVESLLEAMTRPDVTVATPVLRCDAATLDQLREDRRQGRVGGTTVVCDNHGKALYFSKEVLPFGADAVLHHVGAYAYRPDALHRYRQWPEGALEAAEGLEQLRFLENGVAVHCVPVDARGRRFWELNNPEDVALIEQALQEQGKA